MFFNQAKLKINAKNVTQLDFINKQIKSYNTQLLDYDLNEIKERIESHNIIDKKIRNQHVNTIKTTIKENENKEMNMICPKCGGKLVEQNGKYGKFIGCSNYPNCKYIQKNIN